MCVRFIYDLIQFCSIDFTKTKKMISKLITTSNPTVRSSTFVLMWALCNSKVTVEPWTRRAVQAAPWWPPRFGGEDGWGIWKGYEKAANFKAAQRMFNQDALWTKSWVNSTRLCLSRYSRAALALWEEWRLRIVMTWLDITLKPWNL